MLVLKLSGIQIILISSNIHTRIIRIYREYFDVFSRHSEYYQIQSSCGNV